MRALAVATYSDELADILPASELGLWEQEPIADGTLKVVDPDKLEKDEAARLRREGYDVPTAKPMPTIWKESR